MSSQRILAVRLGAMGDIIHALPAVASLKRSYPGCAIAWAIDKKWRYLLAENPSVDEIIEVDRSSLQAILATRRRLRREHFDFAVDFQGLIKSALVASAARPDKIYGFDRFYVREQFATLFYSHRLKPNAVHVVDQNLELAASAGAASSVRLFPLPQGHPEGELPKSRFVLANPSAGWEGKQWPLDHYRELALLLKRECNLTTVINGAQRIDIPETWSYPSGLPGLIHATRRAEAVIGVDSGPLHIAAALEKPGVAIFGPTDPARNGPYGSTFTVLRSSTASTTYKRESEISQFMRAITPAQVIAALKLRLAQAATS